MRKTGIMRCALVLLAVLVLMPMIGSALAGGHVSHCCQPKTCPVCLSIDSVRELMRLIACALALAGLRLAVTRAFFHQPGGLGRLLPNTPVACCVRMNN